MKAIGLIGGMSWESSAQYYRLINEEVKRQLGGLHSAKCLLYSVDFQEIEHYQAAGASDKAGDTLANAALSLQNGGADFIVICTNTMHKVIDQIEEKINIPIVHIADATAKQIQQAKLKTVGLLGTKYTMEEDFYKERIEANGIHVLIPSAQERERIHQIIFEELCLGIIEPASLAFYQETICNLIAAGAEGIILGCTEIGLLVKEGDADIPLFDTTLIHALAAVNRALQ
ncbi:aspartate/glutamate racemase family protein [Metasolibacillus sp.]|uniref:aspartate/glutamate racemase family protein n=1 Tax=Metasolibacillus sp. TaxID=2703680 RepID=UPI0025EB56DD|nr:aspartate/glutamate racemase family protein [Metasolibacillus sp.]MCT6925370.1 aspartate/glutamate racemase family protein [Metasolibacillus sp.]MCT6941602.1 aspartate/glutamate racemase family protein [Metasolibacillus sp.]